MYDMSYGQVMCVDVNLGHARNVFLIVVCGKKKKKFE